MSNDESAGIGVLVVTHGKLAEELVEAARIIVPNAADHLRHMSIGWNDDMDAARADVQQAIEEGNRGRGVLILTDMFGGTPTNLCLSFLETDSVEIITGVNLPMLVKTANLATELGRGTTLRRLAECVAGKGRDSVIVASSMLEPDEGRSDDEQAEP